MASRGIAFGLALLIPVWAMAQASVQEDQVKKTLHVDAQAAVASDQADGSEAAPLRTIGKALELAQQSNAKNVGVRILVHPGVYREELTLLRQGDQTDAPIILEALSKGTAVIEGGDRWNDWKKIEGSSVYSRPWPYNLKMWDIPAGWESVTVRDIVRKQEMVVVEGKLLRQVLSPVELKEGTYFVSEEKATIYLCPPAGADPATADVNVSVRGGLTISGRNNLVVRGLTIQHTTQHEAFKISGGKNILLEDLTVQWNNGGMGMIELSDLTARRVVSNHNGYTGMSGWKLTNMLFEDTETSYNNWRGHWGDFLSWDVAGLKHMLVRNGVYRRHKSVGNETGGFWLDFDNQNVVIDGAYWADNLSEGIFIEANQGPITLKNSVICFNHGTGILSTNSERITLENNVLYGNSGAQLTLTGIEDRDVSDHITGETRKLKTRQWTIKDNIWGGARPAEPLIDNSYAGMEPFLTTLSASGNLYWAEQPNLVFRLTGMNLGLPDWQAASGQDRNSLVGDARLGNPDKRDFIPLPDSPVKSRASWPVSTVKFAGLAGLREQKLQSIQESWTRPYPLAAKAAAQFQPLDLAPYANRPLTGPDAGVAGPLDHLATGENLIHGVPFRVMSPQANNGLGTIVLRSTQVEKGAQGKLPAEVVIPVGVAAKAVYLLHGAGYTGEHRAVGSYSFVYEDGQQVAVQIVPLGPGAKDLMLAKQAENESNVQDWWPTMPQFDAENARKVIVAPKDDPLGAVRYLYTLQWINPQPARKIKEIRLKSDPGQPGTLMILSATVLLPE